MDSTTIIIAVCLFAVSVIPFLLVHLNKKKNKKYFVQELATMASCYDSNITKQEIFNNMTFGLDETNGNLFFIKKGKGSGHVKFMPLSKYTGCELHTEDETLGVDQGGVIAKTLSIRFLPKSSENKIVDIELFNATDDYRLSGEQDFGRQWVTIINKICNK